MGDNNLAGEVDHCERHEGGDFEPFKAAASPAVAQCALHAPQASSCSWCSLWHVMPGCAPGSSLGHIHHDKLFGQEHFKMVLLPSALLLFLVGAGAVISDALHTCNTRARTGLYMCSSCHMCVTPSTCCCWFSRRPILYISLLRLSVRDLAQLRSTRELLRVT